MALLRIKNWGRKVSETTRYEIRRTKEKDQLVFEETLSGPGKNLVGRANRWLRRREIHAFKERGIRDDSVNFSKGLSPIGHLYLFLNRCRS